MRLTLFLANNLFNFLNPCRLWDLNTGLTTKRFVGHEKDVLSVSFSADNRQIVSGSRDKTIKLWNTLGECKFEIKDEGHSEWVSCVRFSPNPLNPVIVSAGWDKVVKVSPLHLCLTCPKPSRCPYINFHKMINLLLNCYLLLQRAFGSNETIQIFTKISDSHPSFFRHLDGF